jgi:hypothetical protein
MKSGNTVTEIIHDRKTISRGTKTRFLGLIIDDAVLEAAH